MGQSKYRKALNDVLQRYVRRAQPVFEQYERECSGVQNDYIKELAQKLMNKISDAKAEAMDEAEEAYQSYLDRLDKKAKSISGADVDKGDIVLLESSLYTLNQEEFDVLQDKYEGNRSMERILAGYARKKGNGINPDTGKIDPSLSLCCRFISDEEKREMARKLYRECRDWIGNDFGFGIANYVITMAGDMFAVADKLKE